MTVMLSTFRETTAVAVPFPLKVTVGALV